MRWRLLGLLFFAVAGLVGWNFWLRPEAELWLKTKTEYFLSQRLGQDVSLDSLSLHPFLLRVVAVGIRVGPPADPLFTCRRWTFHTSTAESPFSFFLLTFARSDLDQPALRVPPSAHAFRLNARWWRHLPLHRLTWRNGSLHLPIGSDSPALSFTGMEGSLDLSPGGFFLKGRGASSVGEGDVSLAGFESLRPGAHFDVQGEGSLKKAPLDRLSSHWSATIGRILGTGDFSASASVRDLNVNAFSLSDVRWKAKARVYKGIWYPPTARATDLGVPLDGEISFREGQIELKGLSLFRALTVSGSVGTGTPGALNLSWKGNDLPLADLAKSGVTEFRFFPQRGSLGTEGTMAGTRQRPSVTWKAELDGVGYPGFLLPHSTLAGSWKDDWFSLKMEGMSGQWAVDGPLPFRGKWPATARDVWTLRASHLDLSSLARQNGWPRVSGLLNGTFSLVGAAGQHRPEAEGTLRIDDFSWGVHRETAPVQGRLTFGSDGLRVQGTQKMFDLDVRSSSGVWRVEHLDYSAGGLRLWGRGFLLDRDGQIQLEGGVGGVSVLDFPPLAKKFPLAQGSVSMEGRLTGKWEDPVFTGAIRVEEARWRPGGLTHRGEAALRGGRGGLTVPHFQWDDHLRGEGSWLFGKGGQISVEVEKAPAEELFDFFAASETVGGLLSGKASLTFDDQPGWVGWARFSGEGGHWGTFPFVETKAVVYFRGSHVDVESAEIVQENGSLRAAGKAVLRPYTPAFPSPVWSWDFSGESVNFNAGSLGVSGHWTVRGETRSREATGVADVRGKGVGLVGNGTSREEVASLGDVQAKIFWSPAQWRVEDLTLERGIRARGEMDRITRGISGGMEVTDLALGPLWPRLSSGTHLNFGRVNGTGTLLGSWSDPRGDLTLTLQGAQWKDLSIDGDLHAVWKGGWEIPRFAFAFEEKRAFRKGGVDGTLVGDGGPAAWQKSLRLDGQFQRADASPWTWKSQWDIQSTTATVKEAVLTTDEGLWRLRPGSRIFGKAPGEWEFRLNNDIRNIHLGPLQVFGGFLLDGNVSFKERAVSGRIGAESLWVNQRVFEKKRAQFHFSEAALTFLPLDGAMTSVQGRVRFDRWPQTVFENLSLWDAGKRILVFAGELGPALWDFSLEGTGLQAEPLLSLADFDWPISGPWNVKVRGRGSLKEPEVQADISGGPGHIGPLPYERLEARAHWVGEWVDVSGLRLSRRKGYLLTGTGRFPVRDGAGAEATELSLRLTEGNLGILKDIWPVCRRAGGSFFGDVRVAPGPHTPQVTGSFHVKDGRMDLYAYAPRVRQLNGDLTFQNDRARVDHARARVGSGWIEMAGDIGIHGLSPVEYDLSIQSDGPRGVAVEVPQLSVPPGPLLGHFSFFSEKLKGISYGEPHVSLRVKGPHGRHVISGSAVLEETHFTYPPDKESFSGIPGPLWWRNFWRSAAWDIQFNTGKETWYRNEYVNVRLDGGLHLWGQTGDWALNGRVGTSEGAINYLGQIFQVNRGDFEVTTDARPGIGRGEILPFVSGEAERVVTTVDARGLSTDDTISMVVDRALLGEIQPRFVSRNNPDLKSERVAMKALGLSSERQGTPADRDQLFRAGLVQLVGSSAAPLANRLAQKLGIGMISPIYEPPEAQETAPTVAPATPDIAPSAKASPLNDYLRGAGASARIRLTDRLSGVYKVKLDEAKNQTYFRDQIELILRVKGSLYVRASSELDSQSLLGQPPERRAVLENQWRFGLPKRKKKEASEPVK